MAAGLTALLILLGVGPAQAAMPAVTYPAAISNIKMEHKGGSDPNRPATVGNEFKLTANWSVPNGAKAGETFGMVLPEELQRVGAGFDLTNDNGDVVGSCTLSQDPKPILLCTLSEFVNGKEDIGGSLWFFAQARKATTEKQLGFEVNKELILVDIPGNQGIIGTKPAPTKPAKDGWSTSEHGRMGWTIRIPSDVAQNGKFTVQDKLVAGGMDLENHSYVGGSLKVSWVEVVDGRYDDNAWVDATADIQKNTLTNGGKAFELVVGNVPEKPQRLYQVMYFTKGDGQVFVGDKFANKVTVESIDASSTFTYQATGGGTGDGKEYTRFSIAKSVEGNAASQVPAGTTFTVRYSVGGQSRELPVGMGEDNRVQSERYKIGSTFVIEEVNLPDVPGLAWGSYTITGDGVTDNGDGTFSLTPKTNAAVALNLTNVATKKVGNLEVTKSVTGEGSSKLPVDTSFSVNYAYTLEGQDPTTGELAVRAGETVSLPEALPLGTEVTLTEAKPADVAVDDATKVVFGQPVFTVGGKSGPSATVTIEDADEPVRVSLENPTTVSEVPPVPSEVPPTPSKPTPPVKPAGPQPGLPVTGSNGAGLLAGAAALMLALSGVAFASRRRAKARS